MNRSSVPTLAVLESRTGLCYDPRTMNIHEPTMDEAASRFWSAIFAAATTIALIGGGIYSLVQYFDSREKERRTYEFQVKVAEFEARKPFYSKQLDLCSEASGAAATIATTKDPKKKRNALDDFWRLYWGPLGIVEGKEVAPAMVSFGQCLNGSCDGKSLKFLSLDIAHSCRNEISSSWELNLPTVQERPAIPRSNHEGIAP